MAQHIINLDCIGDTYVDYDNPNTNFSTQAALKLKRASKISFLEFALSDMPIRKKIISASLKIYFEGFSGIETAAGCAAYVRSYDVEINENEITFNLQPYYIATATNHGMKSIGINSSDINTFVDVPLTTQIDSACAQNRSKVWIDWYINSAVTNEQTYTSKEGSNDPYLQIVYEDVPPNAPIPTEPIGLYKDSKSIARFAWQYSSDVGGVQKKFDLQWSVDQSTWTTVSETTADNYYDMPADTFSAGNIYWRVRCYNEYDEVGDYCAIQSFYAIGAPAAPALNTVPTNSARPVVSWSAFNQQVYQLQVLSGDDVVYDSGIVPGINIRSHKVTVWLADGSYTVQIRIKNEYDLWSACGEAAVTISTVKPAKPSVTATATAYGIDLSITNISAADYALIYRDSVCVGNVLPANPATYHDNAAASGVEGEYIIRAVSEDEAYTDSDVVKKTASFKGSLISPVSDLSNVFTFSRSLNAPPKRVYNRVPGGASVLYAGRAYPVWEPTEHISTGLSLSFFLRTWDEVETFTAIYDLNQTALYRDAKGRKIYGTLSNLQITDDLFGYIVSFAINQTDYVETLEV